MIPKIINTVLKSSFDNKTTNILSSFLNDKSYWITNNKFELKSIKIGPFDESKWCQVTIYDFCNNILGNHNKKSTIEKIDDVYYFVIVSKL